MAVNINNLARRVAELERAMTHKRKDVALTNVQKFLSNGTRTIRGIASTASVDRVGDVVVPTGGKWSLPVPLLWSHDHQQPIGWVREAVAKADGVHVVCEIAEGIPKADEVWAMLESELVSSFSIGFIGKKGKPIETGYRWDSWELIELSVVVVPANADAKITARKGQPKQHTGSIRLNKLPVGAIKLSM